MKVKEWGGDVIVRVLTGAERVAFEDKVNITNGKDRELNLKNFLEKLVVATAVDEDGKHLFTDEDIVALSRKSASAILKVAKVAQRINGLTTDDVDELTKN